MKKIDTDITKATTLKRDFYALESSFKDALENVFAKNWQWISDDSIYKDSIFKMKLIYNL